MTMNTLFNSSNLKLRLFKSIGANAYGQLISVGIQLISVPVFLHYWGIELYGEWLILSAIPAYLSLSDIGFASVAGNDMTMRMAKGDQHGALEVYQSIWILISATSMMVGCIAGLLVWSVPLTQFISLPHVQADQASLALFALLVYVLIGLQGGVLTAGFRCNGRYAYGTILNNTVRLMEWVLAVIVLAFGGGVGNVALAFLIGRIFGTIALWLALRRQSPWLVLGYREGNLTIIRKLFKPALAFMAFPLGLALNIQGMVLIIGIFIGPAAVTIFTAYRTLTRLLVQIITLLNQAVWPEISSAYGAGAIDVVRKLHQKGSAVTFWIGLSGVIFIGIGGDFIVGIWTRHALESNHVLLGLLLSAGFVNILWQTSWVVLMATNRHQEISVVFIASATAALIFSIIFFSWFGINGAALSLIIAELPMLFFAINGALKILKDNWVDYAKVIFYTPFLRKRLYK